MREGLFGWRLVSTRVDAAPSRPGRCVDEQPERVCLGEAAYGGSVTVQSRTPEQHLSCFDTTRRGISEVDRLDIVPADPGECPAPG